MKLCALDKKQMKNYILPFCLWKRLETSKENHIWQTRDWYYIRYGHYCEKVRKAIEKENQQQSKKMSENKTNAPTIKLPVRLDGDGYWLVDADGNGFAQVDSGVAEQIVAALNEADTLRAERDDLAMFVRRFLGSKFVPHCELAVKAKDYLKRKGLQGSLLRDEEKQNGK